MPFVATNVSVILQPTQSNRKRKDNTDQGSSEHLSNVGSEPKLSLLLVQDAIETKVGRDGQAAPQKGHCELIGGHNGLDDPGHIKECKTAWIYPLGYTDCPETNNGTPMRKTNVCVTQLLAN